LIRWDAPEHYGTACKRMDARDPAGKSVFNSRREMPDALERVIKATDAEVVVVSFSNEGFVSLEALVEMCLTRGEAVQVLAFDNKRHVGALIGIYNPTGEKVGTAGATRNTEYVVLCGPAERIEAMAAAVRPA
jgi:adenine-specific DNA-methyltransferase